MPLRLTKFGVMGLLRSLSGQSAPTPPPSITPPTVWWDFEGPDGDGHWPSRGNTSAFLQDVGDPATAVPGLVGDCAKFDGGSIQLANPVALEVLGVTDDHDWSLAIWHKTTTYPVAASDIFLQGYNDSLGYIQWEIRGVTGGDVTFTLTLLGSGIVTYTYTAAANDGNWHFYVLRYTVADGTVGLSIDGGAEVTDTLPGVFAGGQHYSWRFGGGPFNHLSFADSSGWWRTHRLTDEEIVWLYNAGAGRSYPG